MKIRTRIPLLLAASVIAFSGCSLTGESSSETEKEDKAASAVSSAVMPDVSNDETYEIEDFTIKLPKGMETGDDKIADDFLGDVSKTERLGIGITKGAYKNDDIDFIYAVLDYSSVMDENGLQGAETRAVYGGVSAISMQATSIITDQGIDYFEYDHDTEDGEELHYKVYFMTSGLKVYTFVFGTKLADWEKLGPKIDIYIKSITTQDSQNINKNAPSPS